MDHEAGAKFCALWLSGTANVTHATVVPIAGEHYLHHPHAHEIADGFRAWSHKKNVTAAEVDQALLSSSG